MKDTCSDMDITGVRADEVTDRAAWREELDHEALKSFGQY